MRSPWAFSLVWVTAACSGGQPPKCFVTPSATDGYVAIGKEATVPVSLTVQCFDANGLPGPGPIREVTGMTVEVFDPDNRRVAAVADAPVKTGDTSFVVETKVRFTPDRAGEWTVIVNFEPNVGRTQMRIRTLGVRTDAGFRELPAAELPTDCVRHALTASERPVCLRWENLGPMGFRQQLAVGAQRIDGYRFVLDGDAVWVDTRDDLVRYAPDDAGTYVQTHRLGDVVEGFAAGNGALFVFRAFQPPKLARIDVGPAGALSATPVQAGALRVEALALADDRLLLVGRDENTFAATVRSLLVDGGTSAQSIDAFTTAVQSDGAVFVRLAAGDALNATLAMYDVANGRVRDGTLAFAPAQTIPPEPSFPPETPIVRIRTLGTQTRRAVPVPSDTGLGIELYDVGPGYEDLSGASRRHVFARSLDGKTLKVFDR